MTASPELSVVVPSDSWKTIRPVVERLRRQTVASVIELVLVVPAERAGEIPAVEELGRVTVVTLDPVVPLAPARAAGVRAATAPWIFLGETHSYPERAFAEAILAATTQGPWDVIVPRFENANPSGLLSWIGFVSDYGHWTASGEGREIDFVPVFNAVHRRRDLLELGDGLETALGHGDELALHLRRRGARSWLAPRARLAHVNVTRPAAWLGERYGTGRVIGAARGRRWGWPRRLLYAAAAPLIAVVLARRWLAGARIARGEASPPRGTGAGIVLAAVIKACGEAVGYLFGSSPGLERRVDDYEVRKLHYATRGGG